MRIKNKQTGKVMFLQYTGIKPGYLFVWSIQNRESKYVPFDYFDNRIWQEVKELNSTPLVTIETSLCKLFNSFFGFNLLKHKVHSLKDLEGYYI